MAEKEMMNEMKNAPLPSVDVTQYDDEVERILIKASNKIKITPSEEMTLKIAYCRAKGIPLICAQDLYVIYGKVSQTVDFLESEVKKQIKTFTIRPICYSAEKVIIQGNRNPADPEEHWIPITWDKEKAMKQTKGSISLWQDWLNTGKSTANMLGKRAISEAISICCPMERRGNKTNEDVEIEECNKDIQDEADLKAQEIAFDDINGPSKSTAEVVAALAHEKERKSGQKMTKKIENYDPDAELEKK